MTTALEGGVALKPQHYDAACACRLPGLWLEVHAENYMVPGGPRLAWLEAIRHHHPISLHGVGMSLGAAESPDADHLARLQRLVRRVEPIFVSEHLAWSTWRSAYYPDLLPVPRTSESLARLAANISRTQDAIGRSIAIENPAHYVELTGAAGEETEFLAELARRSGCGLLLDVNNVFVSAHNLGYSADKYIDAFPLQYVREIHLAGHRADPGLGEKLLIDSHDTPIAPAVWRLFERAIARIGARPTLIERDGDVPAFSTLLSESERAARTLRRAQAARAERVCA